MPKIITLTGAQSSSSEKICLSMQCLYGVTALAGSLMKRATRNSCMRICCKHHPEFIYIASVAPFSTLNLVTYFKTGRYVYFLLVCVITLVL